uniref:Reverse transcriptase domain-containing protein n=1 Tax=Monopterus albus TaxID=43700 RepID=A0A3Q3IMY9_MONAL
MLDHFNEHFISAGCLSDSLDSEVSGLLSKTESSETSSRSTLNTFSFTSVPISEVHSALSNLDTRKAAGPDGLDPFFLKLAADYIAEPLSYVFNLSLSSNEIPVIWKSAFVLPLLKEGDPSEVNNYRPISKLCVLAKILEKIVSDQLKGFLESNYILSPFQSGFRKQHSTVTATLKFLNDVLQALDCKKHCVALFIDLSKAFDTVDHVLLINSLLRIGLSEGAIPWFRNYLSNRRQAVQLGGSSSSFLEILKGVPQGSVLGPILFSIYINNVCDNLTNAMYHFYADDTVIYCCSSTLAQAAKCLQHAFDIVQFR